jgi:hypothetical protein
VVGVAGGENRPSLLVLFEVLFATRVYFMLLRPARFRC